jgi:putative CocE/NonD family hydrolase
VFDPDQPVPSLGGTITSGKPVMVGGAFDQREGPRFFGCRAPYRPLAERPDVMVFQTEPLAGDVEVTGAIVAHLHIASDCPDTDFVMKLIDVYPPNPDYPDGFAMNLTDGIVRCRYRNSWSHPEPLIPGQPAEVAVEAFPTANLFKSGHRIRVDISSSNFPHFDVNPNTGAPEGAGQERRVARNTLFLDAAIARRASDHSRPGLTARDVPAGGTSSGGATRQSWAKRVVETRVSSGGGWNGPPWSGMSAFITST